MAVYIPCTGKKSVMAATLGEFAEMGYDLRQNGDHIVELFFKDALVDRFSQLGATIEEIRNSCRKHWGRLNGVQAR